MDAFINTLITIGVSLGVGALLGAAAVWSVLARKVDARARDLSKAAFEGYRPVEPMTADELHAAAASAGYTVRPIRQVPGRDQ